MKTKRIFAILLAVVCMLTCMPCTAFAAENSNENSVVTSHTITIEIPAGESCESEVMPCIWEQEDQYVSSGSVFDTAEFYIPDRYFAYEICGTPVNGSLSSRFFYVNLMFKGATKTSFGAPANGTTEKNDWISIVPQDYYFQVINPTDYNLSVTITYYSWK